ncbi:hypothetical protein Pla52n_17000 [Stieleria varia]|uniref:Peptidase C-terminal archaeal/bacterial domain-containing protein n=2 Tax=Stieleria varia TaxID=2528005 RepID=A0A5C6B654_9BACT|nr:hypothetical protein Pla52n_17000 [Stieleria varia]
MIATLVAVFCSTHLMAALPIVTSLKPMGVVRGTETVVTLKGDRLSDASEVICDLPGIEILEVKAVDDKTTEVKLKAADNLAPGLYPIRLVTKSGIANLRLLGVGTMPVIEEVEPNNEFAAPQSIPLNSTVEGIVQREDVEHFQVELKAGQKINVEIEGIRLAFSLNNQNILDPYIAILDEGRFEVATSDDSALLQQDGFCSYTAEKDGKYTILVRDSSFLGSGVCGYRLHVGTFPRPVAVLPAGGAPGSILKAQLIDDEHKVINAEVQLPGEPLDRWGVITENENGISPSPNWVRVNELPVAMEVEPNDDRMKAPEVTVPGALCGVVEKPDDYDCFRFQAKKDTRYRVEVFAREILRSPLDAVLNVFDPKGATLVSSDDSRGKIDPFLDFTAKEDGLHSVRIYDHLRGGSPEHCYRIEVTTPQPSVSLTLSELRRDEAQVVSVPIGGQTAMMVAVGRDQYNGEVSLSLDGLPAGVTATTFPVPAGRPEVPVLLTAAADAKHSASLYTINAKGDDKSPTVFGTLSQTHKLVLGQNRRGMFEYVTPRAAMAVTDEAPFSVEVVQPKTPILRNGSKDIVVKLTRKEGFDGRVSFRTLYNPPGIGVNNSRYIDKGQTECTIPMTANGGASIGTWPMIFVATYSTPIGSTVCSTLPIMLEVQDSLFKYEFPKAAGELGTEINYTLTMEILREFEGEAEVELVGLPAGVTSPAATQKIAKDATSVTFPLVIPADAKVGKHKTLVCQSKVTANGETMLQTTGTGELRIDKPLPPKVDEPKVEKPAEPQPPKPEAPKVLSRLEQLRLQSQE